MSMRPVTPSENSVYPYTRCEDVLDGLLHDGPVIDAERVHAQWKGDRRCIRYSRNVLNMFAQLNQLEHVRRELWVEKLAPTDPRIEHARLAVASRAIGDWTVVGGTWALQLHGIELRHRGGEVPVRFALTPRRARPTTYDTNALARPRALPRGANEHRHVTMVLGEPIAAVTRSADRIGNVEWISMPALLPDSSAAQGMESMALLLPPELARAMPQLGGHVLSIADAFISLLEHPRLSGGFDTAWQAALPVLARTGLDAVLEAGRRHPVLAVRRRLSFVLFHAVLRTQGAISWLGPDESGWIDDEYERWRIPRTLGVLRSEGAPTILEPHRHRVGRLDRRMAVFDNRSAVLRPVRTPAVSRHRSHENRGGEQAGVPPALDRTK
jgi:hypothetical protein